jgi:hypothetical protein
MLLIQADDTSELAKLMDAAAYEAFLATLE